MAAEMIRMMMLSEGESAQVNQHVVCRIQEFVMECQAANKGGSEQALCSDAEDLVQVFTCWRGPAARQEHCAQRSRPHHLYQMETRPVSALLSL